MRETYSDLGFEPDVESLVRSTAAAYGVDPDLAVRVAKQESGFKQSAQSKKGATGVMQLMPGTAKNLGVDPHDLQQNIEGGVRYLKTQLDAFGGDVPKALAAYNWGPGNVRKGGSPPKETVDYVKAITGADYPYAPAAPYSDLGFEPETTPTVAPIAAPAVASPHADLGFEPEGGAAPAVEQPSTGQPAPAFEGPIPSLEEIQAADADLKQRADAITQRAVALDQEQAQLEAEGAQLTDLLRRSQILPVGPRDEGEREILVAQFNEKIAAHNAARQQLQAEVEQFNSSLAQLQAGVAAFNENVKRWSSLTVPPGAEKTGLPGIPGPQIPMAYDPLGDNPERVQQWGRIGKMLRPIDTLMRAGSAAVMGTIGGTVGAPLQIIGRELEGRAPGTVIGKAGEAIRDIGEEVSEFARRGTQIRPEDAAKLSASWIKNPLLLLDPDYIAHQAGMAGGSMLSFLLPTMGVLSKMQKASALTKTAAGVGGASFLESLTNAGQNYDEAIDRGADPKTAAQVFVTTLKRDFPVTAGLNVLGLFNPAIKSKPVRVAASTLTEPVQEVAQGAIQRQTMKEQVDPSIDIREGMDVEALGGLIGGAIGGAVLPESATRAPERAPQPVSMPPSPAPTPARPRVRPAAKPAAQPIETPSPGARAAAQPVEYNEGDQFRGKAGVYRVTQITENEVSYELTNRAGKKRMASMPVDDFERFVRRAEKITDAQPQRVETEPAGKPASARAGEDAGAAAAGKFPEEIRKKSGKLPEESATEPAAGVEAPAFKPGDRVEWTINGQRRTGTIIEAAPEAFGLEGKWQVQVDGVQGPRGHIRSVDAEILKPLAVEPEAQAAPIPATKSDSIEEAERKPASAPEAAAATETPAAPAAAPQSERGAQDKGSQVEIDLREPWQMTWDDFRKVTAKLPRGPVSEEAATRLLRQQHREIIEKALDEGKPVPDEVLKDYPDLAKAAQAAEPASAAPRALSAGEATKPAENIPENIPAEKPNYDYASTQVNLPEGVAANVLKESKKIADEDLADDGRETEPHVTVLYGLHGEDPEAVRKLLADEPPVRVTFGKTSIFPDDGERGSDVVKIDVDSEDLARLNKKIADALPHTVTHPGYKPHITLAYVKPGRGKKYAGANDLEGQEILLKSVVFSGKDGKQTEIALGGKREEKAEAPTEPERATYPDGRLIPVEGDEVFQTVRGFGGSPAYVHGKVETGKGGQLRVRITGGASLMGGNVKGVGRSQALDGSWTVKNDPEVKRREDERKAQEQARKDEREREEQEDREKREAFIKKHGETKASDVEPGDILEDYEGRRVTAREIADGEVYAHEAGEDEKTAPGYFPGPFRKTGEKAGPDYWRGQLANARANLKSLRDEVPTATELIAEREAEVKLAERKLGEAMRAAGKEEKGPEAAEGTAKTTDNISPESKESAQLALTGDTYRHRIQLRKLGATWNKERKAWIIDADKLPDVQRISKKIEAEAVGEAEKPAETPEQKLPPGVPSPKRDGDRFLDTRFDPPRAIATILPDDTDVKLVPPYDQMTGADRNTLLGAIEWQLQQQKEEAKQNPAAKALDAHTRLISKRADAAYLAIKNNQGADVSIEELQKAITPAREMLEKLAGVPDVEEARDGLRAAIMRAEEMVAPHLAKLAENKRRKAKAYVDRIVNAQKRHYASAYMRYLLGERAEAPGDESLWGDLSHMAKQAVRIELTNILGERAEKAPEAAETPAPTKKDVTTKAAEIWAAMTASERAGVRMGLFPAEIMLGAEKEGYTSHELSVALMDEASKAKVAKPAKSKEPANYATTLEAVRRKGSARIGDVSVKVIPHPAAPAEIDMDAAHFAVEAIRNGVREIESGADGQPLTLEDAQKMAASIVTRPDVAAPAPAKETDLAAAAGISVDDIIEAATKALSEKLGKTPLAEKKAEPSPAGILTKGGRGAVPPEAKAEAPTAAAPGKPRNALSSAADAARARMRARMSGETLTSGIDPQVLIDMATIGAEQILDKAIQFKDWSERMMREAGDMVRWVAEQSKLSTDEVLRQIHRFAAPVAKRFGVEAEATPEATPATPSELKPGSITLAEAVLNKLRAGELIGDNTALQKLADEAFGGSRAEGKYLMKDAYDAMEAAVNRYFVEIGPRLFEADFEDALKEIRKVVSGLPTQNIRSAEQEQLQQFSTPPTEAFTAVKLASIRPSDVVLEPSAGTGGLAAFAKAAGATVHVNEIDPARRALLEWALDTKATAADAEFLDSTLPQEIRPTVVVMNPPFSATGGRITAHKNLFGYRHVTEALKRLEDGGRLVAILGRGATMTAPSAKTFWRDVRKKYAVLANVGIPGKEYAKYGTTFDTRLVVIDKTGPTQADPITGDYKSLEEAYAALDAIAEARRGEQEARPDTSLVGDHGPVRGTARAELGEDGGRGGGPEPAAAAPSDLGVWEARPGEGTRATERQEPRPETGAPEQEQTPRRGDRLPGAGGATGVTEEPSAPIVLAQPADIAQIEEQKKEDLLAREEDDSAYVEYVPAIKGPAHPGRLVETKVMASVSAPTVTYQPHLPASVLAQGRLSAAQMESVARAGMNHQQFDEGGRRLGFLLGDGTGVGKGRQIAAMIWDNWRQGRKRAIWVSASKDLLKDAKRDFDGIGAAEISEKLHILNEFPPSSKINVEEGVIFFTYQTLIAKAQGEKGQTRLQQIQDWLGEDGVIVFDEAHKAKNAIAAGGRRSNPTKTGEAVLKLQDNLPKAYVVYASATSATEVANMGYMTRLGIWGKGTPFHQGFGQFMTEVGRGGVAAMELISRELKALGKYLSRSISYKGVTYDEVIHGLTPEQKETYDTAAAAWQLVLNAAKQQIRDNNADGSPAQGKFAQAFWGEHQRFFRKLLTSMKVPRIIQLTDQALAEGKAVVISLIGTGQSAADQALAAMGENQDEDLDFSPKETLIRLIRENYPVTQYEEYEDDEGKIRKRPVMRDGKTVENAAAVRAREALIRKIDAELQLPDNPLDSIIRYYGRAKVAELTGRKKTVERNPKTGRWEEVSRAPEGVPMDAVNEHEMEQFQSAKKRIAIISKAAGTGISLHADLNAKNQRPRYHVVMELSWSADDQMQSFGRTHRTNQKQSPEYVIVSTDIGGERRFSSTIARRLESLGALTKGQRDATGGGVLAKYNFETQQGRQAAQAFYESLLHDQEVPGSRLSGHEILQKMGILKQKVDHEGNPVDKPYLDREDLTNVTRLLNRILNIESSDQNAVFDYFTNIFDSVVQNAIESGTLDTGVNLVRGDSIKLVSEKIIATDPVTGAKTYHYEVDVHRKNYPVVVQFVRDLDNKNRGHMYRHREKGNLIWAEKSSAPITNPRTGNVETAYRFFRPEHREGKDYERIPESELKFQYERIGEKEHDELKEARENLKRYREGLKKAKESDRPWDIQYYTDQIERTTAREKALAEAHRRAMDSRWELWKQAYDAAPKGRVERIHMIGGSVMRVWNSLNIGGGRMDIRIAYPDEGGSVTGVVMSEADANRVERALTGEKVERSPGSIFEGILEKNETVELTGNIRLNRGRINKQPVINVTAWDYNQRKFLDEIGVRKERIGWNWQYYLPNERKEAVPILEKLLKQYPVVEQEEEVEGEIPGINARLDYEAPLGEAQLPGFYSQLERVIEQKMPPRATVQQALAILRNPQNGVKRDELDWTGVETFLKERTGSVSKQELLDFVRANQVEVEEIHLGYGIKVPEVEDLKEQLAAATRDQQARDVLKSLEEGNPFAQAMQDHASLDLAEEVGGRLEITRPTHAETVHHLAITPAMRESVMAGQPLFALSWEAIDAAPDLGTIGKNARTATARYKSRPGGGVLWLNFEGAYLINVASRHNPNLVFRGLHASRASARQIAERLRAMAENLESTAERAGIWRVASALERAAEDGESIIMAQTGATSIKRLKSTLRHERFHAQQAELGRGGEEGWKHVNPAALLVHPIARKALQRLYQRGYAKATDEYKAHALAMEIGAHLAEGERGWKAMGINRDEARELFRHYANLLLDMHGEDLPSKLRGLAPQWNKELENVRREKGTHLRPGRYGADREVGPGPTGWDVRQGIRPALPGEQASLPEDPGERRKAVESSRVPSERGAGEQIPSTKTPQTPAAPETSSVQRREEVAFRSTAKPSKSLELNNQGILYTTPDESYSKYWGPYTQRLLISPKRTLDFTSFAADEEVPAAVMREFLEEHGVEVSEDLMRRFRWAEDAGGELLQYFGEFGQRALVDALKKAGYDSARINEWVADTGKTAISTLLFDAKLARVAPPAEAKEGQKAQPERGVEPSPVQRIEDNAEAGFINLDLVTFGLASRLAPRPEDTSGPVSKKLIRSVRAAQHKLDMPDWRFRQILKRETGKTSTKDLTQHEAQRLIDSLIARGVESLGLSRTLFNAVKVIHSPAWWLKRSAAGEKMYQSAEDHWFEQIRLRDQLAKWWQKANAGLSKAEINRIGLYRDTKQLLDHYGDPERVARILERAGEDPAILDDLEGYLSPKLKAVSDRWSEIFEWTRKKGVEAGFLEPEQKINTYLPFYYDSFFRRHPERIKDAAVDLAQELGIPSHFAEQLLKQSNAKNVKFGSFDLERLLWLLPGMRDPNQRFEIYSKGFARKMAVTGFLREANKLYPKIQDPHIRELAHEYINQYAGRPASSQSYQWGRIAGILTGLQYTAKIGFNLWSPLLNLTQTVINTVPQVGLTRTAMVIPRALMASLLPSSMNPFVRDIVRLQRAGILDTFSAKFERPRFHGIAENIQEAAGFLFDKTEQLNRSIAFLAGLEQARARGLKGEAAVKHARSVVRITQFFSGRLDAPLFARTPIGKVLMQFKTFTFKEIEFIRQLDWKQQVKFVVATIALGGPAAFLIVQALKRFWPDEEITKLAEELQESYNLAAFLQAEQLTRQLGIFTVPGLEDLGGWEFGNRILSWAAGPTINSFIRTAQDAGRWVADPEGSNRASMTPAERFVTTLIRSWMPGGTEILRVKRAMDEADSPQEALRILINAAGPAGSRKASADAVAFGVESEALVY